MVKNINKIIKINDIKVKPDSNFVVKLSFNTEIDLERVHDLIGCLGTKEVLNELANDMKEKFLIIFNKEND